MSVPTPAAAKRSAYALIIGISEYRDPKIPALNFTHADAQAFSEVLLDPRRAGFPAENVKLLLDEQATLLNIKRAISTWLYQSVKPESTVIVFFAGHGHHEEDKAGVETDGLAKYLLPWDADSEDLYASSLSSTDLEGLVRRIKAQRLIFFIDACYAAGVAHGARDVGGASNPSFDRLGEGEGRVLIAAAKPMQRSWEDTALGHGLFTYHLLEALSGKADIDKDGYVSISEVFKYLEREVPLSARRLAKGLQEPFMVQSVARDIILTVDAVLAERMAAERSEVEQKRKERIRSDRAALFELLNRDVLPRDAYTQALNVVEKPSAELSEDELLLSDVLRALLAGNLSPEQYLKIRARIHRESRERSSRDRARDVGPGGSPPHRVPLRYCITCGMEIRSHTIFCIGCGRRF